MSIPVKFKAEVKKITNYGDGIYHILFELKNGIARFKPGQFLHLTLDEYDPTNGFWPEPRVFSIVSLPNRNKVEIIYSVKGKYTKRMSEELFEGREIWLKLPYGDFIIEKYINTGNKIYLMAGGTGISPFIPFLLNYSKGKYNNFVALYYGIRSEKYYIYRELIESLQNKIQVNIISGMMDIDKICSEISKDKSGKFFISGPPQMIKSFKENLISKNVDSGNIILDEWE